MARMTAWVLLILVATGSMAGCASILPQQDKTWELTLVVGALLGDDAVSSDLRGALDLAIGQVRSADLGIDVTLHTQRATGNGVQAFDALTAKGAVVVFDLRGPADASAVAQRAATAKRVLLVPTPSNLSAGAGGAYAFQLAPDATSEANALAALAARASVERLAVVGVDDAYGRALAAALDARVADATVSRAAFAWNDSQAGVRAGRDACAASPDGVLILAYPDSAIRVLEGLSAGGCLKSVQTLASHTAFQVGFAPSASDPTLAPGLQGVMPATAQPTVFRSMFEVMFQEIPGPFAAEAYDGLNYAAIAAFASKGSPSKASEKVRATVTADDVRGKLAGVASAPGTKYRELAAAVGAAKAGEDLDWIGQAHDLDLQQGQPPKTGAWVAWRVEADGRARVLEGSTLS